MKDLKFEVKKKITLTKEDIGDVICTALEGGSNYWYMIANKDMKRVVDATPHMKNEPTVDRIVEAVFEKGVEVDFYDIEEAYNPEAEKLGTLSVESFKRGVELYHSKHGEVIPDEMDANDADILFQYVIMGKIVFG